jgi:hypothetical protein
LVYIDGVILLGQLLTGHLQHHINIVHYEYVAKKEYTYIHTRTFMESTIVIVSLTLSCANLRKLRW